MPEGRNRTLDPTLFAGNARFRSLVFVGRGSMGSVYRAFDAELGSVVALKMIQEGTAQRVYELKQEYRTPAGIDHPNLIKLQDLVVSEDVCCFTMEFVEGPDFVEHVRGNTSGDSCDAMLTRFYEAAPQLVNGLSALHAAGRLHRDVKPPNVRVDPNGRVVILDFDLAAPIHELGVTKSAAGELAGTFAYMAPEQLWGVNLSPATDWYAVGWSSTRH
jgi:serine/threonine protein kinase